MRVTWFVALWLSLSLSAAAPAAAQFMAGPPARAEVIAGRNTIRSIQRAPVGIVYLFHGSGGSETFAGRLHSRLVLAKLAARGYGYVAAPSGNREEPARWDLRSADPASNADVAYMLALHQTLVERGEIRSDTPVFTMGMSNGGGFANLFAAAAKARGLPVRAIGDYMGPIPAPARSATGDAAYPPLFIVLGANDGLVGAEAVNDVARRLSDAGAKVEVHLTHEASITPDTFGHIEGLTAADRKAVLDSLVAGGVLDPAGRRLVFKDKPKIGRPEMAELAKMIPAGPHARDVMNELLIAWAGHQMRSDFADDQVRFFDQILGR